MTPTEDNLRKVGTAWQGIAAISNHWLHLTYIVLGVVGWIYAGYKGTPEVQARIAYIALFFYVAGLFLFLLYFIYAYSRKSRYAEAMFCMHEAIHVLRDLTWYLQESSSTRAPYNKDRVKSGLQDVINSVSEAFGIVTGVRTRACIKMIGGEPGDEHVVTLCRDSGSASRSGKRDARESNFHKLVENTDFRVIVEQHRDFYWSDNLAKHRDYSNTSVDKSPAYDGQWLLPYISTLVLPIRYTLPKAEAEATGVSSHTRYLGFLCLDTLGRNSFNKRYDVQMAAAIADGLSGVLNLWSIVERKRGSAGSGGSRRT